jgi:hypothetical protein
LVPKAMPWKRHLADISEEFARHRSLSENGEAAAPASRLRPLETEPETP